MKSPSSTCDDDEIAPAARDVPAAVGASVSAAQSGFDITIETNGRVTSKRIVQRPTIAMPQATQVVPQAAQVMPPPMATLASMTADLAPSVARQSPPVARVKAKSNLRELLKSNQYDSESESEGESLGSRDSEVSGDDDDEPDSEDERFIDVQGDKGYDRQAIREMMQKKR